MQPDETARTNGKPPGGGERVAARYEPDELRGAVEVRLALDANAPGAARTIVADCVGARVPAAVRDDAQLLVSELVTNSLQHSGAPAGDGIFVRVELSSSALRVEVEDAGRGGVIAPRAADVETSGGFGMSLVQALSERWGVERAPVGGTRVWAQLTAA
jgi:anti-sigma regulatory factor (Ser/Thr protein kinase)